MMTSERLIAALLMAWAVATPTEAASQPAAPLSACTSITSALQRLECFDRVAGTPMTSLRASVPKARPNVPEIVTAIAVLEKARPAGDLGFRMLESDERDGQRRVLISAPALNRPSPRPLLTLACINNITRLQFIVHPPVQRHQARIALRLDGRTAAPEETWQVLDGGLLVDAGRGLAGIDVVRRLRSAAHLEVASDLPALDGLRFDAGALDALIAAQREACRW